MVGLDTGSLYIRQRRSCRFFLNNLVTDQGEFCLGYRITYKSEGALEISWLRFVEKEQMKVLDELGKLPVNVL